MLSLCQAIQPYIPYHDTRKASHSTHQPYQIAQDTDLWKGHYILNEPQKHNPNNNLISPRLGLTQRESNERKGNPKEEQELN